MNRHWHYQQDPQGIGWLRLNYRDGSANVLCRAVLEELENSLGELENDPPEALVILSGKPGGFIAGADVNEFLEIDTAAEAESHIHWVHGLFRRIESLPSPTVALIHGFCLGGGLELALACRYRIASDDPATRLGFPEVRLGLFPGYGGSVRSVRHMGALKALPLILSGKTLAARQAHNQGLVDWVVPQRQLRDAAVEILQRTPAPRRPPLLERLAGSAPLRPALAWHLKRQAAAHADPQHYPAPGALIDHWRRFGSNPAHMYASEARQVGGLLCGESARNLIRVFQLQNRLKALGRSSDFRPTHVHVVGGGVMGGDIAAWCALQGLRVTLQDTAPRRLSQAMGGAHLLFRRRLREPRLQQAAADRLLPDHRGYGTGRADVVIEAIFEDLEAKRALFHALEQKARPDALLASNTSGIPLERLGEALRRPQRLIGLHFFNPVARMQLVEVVHGADTDPACVAQGLAFTRRIERLPLPVRSAPGFLVNRVLMPYLLEAERLIDEGVPAAAVDQAARRFGMPIGPAELADSVGLDICLAVARELTSTPSAAPREMQRLVADGRLGRKSGRGFYPWRDGQAVIPAIPSGYRPAQDLADRLIFRLLNEAVACLREGVVADADLLDAGVIFGTGFAPFRGGPMHYIAKGGLTRMHERLERLHEAHGAHFAADEGWARLGRVE